MNIKIKSFPPPKKHQSLTDWAIQTWNLWYKKGRPELDGAAAEQFQYAQVILDEVSQASAIEQALTDATIRRNKLRKSQEIEVSI